MAFAAQLAFLRDRGWQVDGDHFDLCWLDCSDPGWLKTWKPPQGRALCICLCSKHALRLENGVYGGDYTGAPLPPDSMADEWPWQYCDEAGI